MTLAKTHISREPSEPWLSYLIEDLFYVEIPFQEEVKEKEFVLPLPRIPFVYFIDKPFLIIDQTEGVSRTIQIGALPISTNRIFVKPPSETLRYVGAHLHPYALAHFSNTPAYQWPRMMDADFEFPEIASELKKNISSKDSPATMIDAFESALLSNLRYPDTLFTAYSVYLIDKGSNNIKVKDLVSALNISDRTLRNHYYNSIGCSPKEYLKLVKLKRSAFELLYSKSSLTNIAYENAFFDQAHFINEIRNITGMSPKELRKKLPDLRFLQF